MTQEMYQFGASEQGFSPLPERTYIDSSTNADMSYFDAASVTVDAIPGESLAEEVDRYVQLCEHGRFYDWMMEKFRIPSENRGRFKQRVYKYVMFGKHERSRHSNEWKLFEGAFPHIAKLIAGIKREHGQ